MTKDFHGLFSRMYRDQCHAFNPDEVSIMVDILQWYMCRSTAAAPWYRLPFFELATHVDEFCMLLGADVFLGNKKLSGRDEVLFEVIQVKAGLDRLCRRMGISLRLRWPDQPNICA
jgi:hypothetical protein